MLLLHGHVHPGEARARAGGDPAGPFLAKSGTRVRNVTGWHLMWIRPLAGYPGAH